MSQSKSNNARAVIELLCTILEESKIHSTRAETFRQAKFDKDNVSKLMGQLLLRVVCVCDNNCKNWEDYSKKFVVNEQVMVYVKTKLQSWGYLSRSFSRVPNDLSYGSRELLLALGWVIHHKNFVNKVIQMRSNPLHQRLSNFVGQEESLATRHESMSASQGIHLPLKDRIQYHMLLTGKLRMALRRLHSVYLNHSKLTSMISKSTYGISLQDSLSHLTPLEVYVIKNSASLKKMIELLEQDNMELSHLLEWKQKEHYFWEWMSSVLDVHLEDQYQRKLNSPSHDLRCADEGVYMPVPSDVGQQIESERDKLRDMILGLEANMSRVEETLQRKRVSKVEIEVHKMHMDKELAKMVEQMRTCGFVEGTDEKSNETLQSFSSLSDVETSERPVRHRVFESEEPKKEFLSPYAVKTANVAAVKEAAHNKISSLKKQVEALERDLSQTQIQNIEKVQSVINMDERIICIQPRVLKQLYEN